MLFSKKCEYGLQALLYLAKISTGKAIQLSEIADDLRIPRNSMSKVLQSLAQHKILDSQKGKNGGFQLRRDPHSITLREVVEATDGPGSLSGCILGFPGCSDEEPCPGHSYWKEALKSIHKMLDEHSIADLSKGLDGKLETLRILSSLQSMKLKIV